MENTAIQDLINALAEDYAKQVDNSIDALLCMGGCIERKDQKKIQIQLAENGYDLLRYEFKDNPYKTFIVLTELNGKFIKGYLVEVDKNTYEVKKELIKSKFQYKKIMGQ